MRQRSNSREHFRRGNVTNHPDCRATNASERLLRPAVIQRKMTAGYRAMWAAVGEADIRTVVDTARLTGSSPFGTILKTIGA